MRYSLLFVTVSLLVAVALALPRRRPSEKQPNDGGQSQLRMREHSRGDREGSDEKESSG